MKLFVVLTNMMGGVDCAGVYCSASEAQERATAHGIGVNPRVTEMDVRGEQPDPDVVYIADYLDRTMDVFHFEGIFGNYEAAMKAAGPDGHALNRKLER